MSQWLASGRIAARVTSSRLPKRCLARLARSIYGMSGQPRFRIWFERAIPSRYAPMLEGVATVATDPAEAHGIVAGSRVPYNADFFQKAPALQVVSRTGIGCHQNS